MITNQSQGAAMSKQVTSQHFPQQLSLDLKAKANPPEPLSTSASKKVAHFVDAATQQVRQQAITRVRAAGIFAPPAKARSK